MRAAALRDFFAFADLAVRTVLVLALIVLSAVATAAASFLAWLILVLP